MPHAKHAAFLRFTNLAERQALPGDEPPRYSVSTDIAEKSRTPISTAGMTARTPSLRPLTWKIQLRAGAVAAFARPSSD